MTDSQDKELQEVERVRHRRITVRTLWYRRRRSHARFLAFLCFCCGIGFSGSIVMVLSVDRASENITVVVNLMKFK